MRAQGIVSHELPGYLYGERRVQPASGINRRQFTALALLVGSEFPALASEIGLFAVRLRVHGYMLAGGHGHGAGHQARDPRGQHIAARGMRRRDAEDEACRRDDAVIGTQYRRPQPANRCVRWRSRWTAMDTPCPHDSVTGD